MKDYNGNMNLEDKIEHPLNNWKNVVKYAVPIYGDVKYLIDMERYFKEKYKENPKYEAIFMRSMAITGKYLIYGTLIKAIVDFFRKRAEPSLLILKSVRRKPNLNRKIYISYDIQYIS